MFRISKILLNFRNVKDDSTLEVMWILQLQLIAKFYINLFRHGGRAWISESKV